METIAEEASTPSTSSESSNKAPWPTYKEIFVFEPELSNEKNYAFTCKLCLGKKIIHASKSSTANLKKHISVSLVFLLFLFMLINKFQYFIC